MQKKIREEKYIWQSVYTEKSLYKESIHKKVYIEEYK